MNRLLPLFLVLGIVLQVGIGIISPLRHVEKEFWQDSLRHNDAAYGAKDYNDFNQRVSWQSQPNLEYAFRRYIVFPVLGFSERSMRLPDWFFWSLTLIFLPFFTYFGLEAFEIKDKTLRLLGVLGTVLWLSNNPTLLSYTVEGRHYAWCAFFSLVWAFTLLKRESLPSWLFHLASFFYINSHFFVWPLVGFFYALDVETQLKSKDFKKAFKPALIGAAIFAGTLAINYSAAEFLWVKPPGAKPPQEAFSLLITSQKFWDVFINYLNTFWILMILIPALAFSGGRNQRKVVFGFLVTLAIFVLLRVKSDYGITPRYFLPFTGVAWLLFLSFASSGIDFIRAKQKKLLFLTLLLATCFLWVGLGGVALAQDLSKLRFPPENFTRLHSVFREFETQNSPVAILSLEGSETTTVDFYQKYLRANEVGITVIRAGQRPDDLKKISQPLLDSQPKSSNFIFLSGQKCRENPANLRKTYFTKDYYLRCLFEIPSELSLTEIEDLIRNIRTDSVIKK